MVSRVIYRPFDESDFNDLAAILQETWHGDAPSPGYGFLEACFDLAHCLSISTFSQVAAIDGVARGVVLARSNSLRVPVAGRWQRAAEDYRHQMQIAEPEAAETYSTTVSLVDRANERLLKQSGLADSNEVTLLAVSSADRGLGIGGVLLDAVTSYLASNGANHAFLYTDTSSSWPFYEHRGFTREAAYRPNREERKLLPKELYVYGLDLNA